HDTLVRPVLEAKAHRLAEEAAIAARVEREQREAEVKKLREEAEKERQRAEEAHRLRQEADKARAEAEAQREKAVAESKRANRQSRRANIFSFFAAITMLTSLIFGISSQRNLRLAREAQARQDLYLFKDLTERGRTLLQSGYIVSAEDLLMRADTLMQKHEENEGFQREKGSLDVLLEEVDRLKNQ
ncbi:MAG: hypothetical protein KDC54_00335, partial [Lewinella sp.]|nr:hypothetical protein [Lewinella sp.]